MDENTKYIVASNLTAAYYAGMENQLYRASSVDPRERQDEVSQPFREVHGTYLTFVRILDERETLGSIGSSE